MVKHTHTHTHTLTTRTRTRTRTRTHTLAEVSSLWLPTGVQRVLTLWICPHHYVQKHPQGVFYTAFQEIIKTVIFFCMYKSHAQQTTAWEVVWKQVGVFYMYIWSTPAHRQLQTKHKWTKIKYLVTKLQVQRNRFIHLETIILNISDLSFLPKPKYLAWIWQNYIN